MRPEPPASFRPSLVERTGVARLLSHTFRMAVRNLERKPWQAVSTTAGLALATAILVVPNAFLDGVDRVLDYQWDVLERDDLWLGLEEPSSAKVQHLFEELPGVRGVEAVRETPVRLNFGSRHRQVPVQGLPADGLQERVVDAASRQIHLPPEGIVISARLARSLGVRVGDSLIMESLEGKHVVRAVPLVGLAEDFSGIAAYMDLHALNRLLDEGDVITGGALIIDSARRSEFLRTLKGIPRVSWVAVKKSMRDNFRNTTAASIGLIQSIYLVFATIMAFGVVYNSARISLAERARELATLRVLGFSRREVGGVLVTELVILALIAAPAGLLLGSGFAAGIISTVNTETVRLPLVLTLHNYAYAVLVVSAAAAISAFFVLRNLNQLNLISVLKAPE
jgi:putative ABC transport system permease protein